VTKKVKQEIHSGTGNRVFKTLFFLNADEIRRVELKSHEAGKELYVAI